MENSDSIEYDATDVSDLIAERNRLKDQVKQLQAEKLDRQDLQRSITVGLACLGDAMQTRFQNLTQAADKAGQYYEKTMQSNSSIKTLQSQLQLNGQALRKSSRELHELDIRLELIKIECQNAKAALDRIRIGGLQHRDWSSVERAIHDFDSSQISSGKDPVDVDSVDI
jgi:chromosome segregation ATPase